MENTKTTALTTLEKDKSIYTKLVEDFMSNQKLKVSDEEKKKFIMLCMVNKLNPRKKEVYAIPYGDKLTLVIGYNVFLQRAEATGLVAWWNILMKKEVGKLKSWVITIHRKDRQVPFVYELDLTDAVNKKNDLWNTKTEDMMRKQLIRIWFWLAFPQIAPVSDPEEITEPQFYHEIEKWAKAPVAFVEVLANEMGYEEYLAYLLSFLPDDYIAEGYEGGASEDQQDEYIKVLQVEIGKRFIKDRTISIDKEDIKNIFIGEDKNIVAMKKEAIKLLPKGDE